LGLRFRGSSRRRRSAGVAGRCDALVSVRALLISVTLWLSG